MIADANSSWMLATIIVTLLAAVASLCAERAAVLRRGLPLRWIWVAAMTLSIVYSGWWLRPTHVVATVVRSVEVLESGVAAATPEPSAAGAVASSARAQRAPIEQLISFAPMSDRVERMVRIAWSFMSVAMFAGLLWSITKLARQRRMWRSAIVHDTSVLIADDFGPAIVGVVRPAIVLPAWVLALDNFAQRTVLLHESEHRRAWDQRLLFGALTLLLIMPWNLALWFMWRRLNRAIELDCDERVLAHGVADAAYADVLIGAWQRAHANRSWVPTPAFAERASTLGRRVEHFMRPMPQRWIMKAMNSSLLAVALMSAALLVPAPQHAQRPTKSPPPPPPRVLVEREQTTDTPKPPPPRVELKARTGSEPIAPPRVTSAPPPTVLTPTLERALTNSDQKPGRILLVPMDDAAVSVLDGVRTRLSEDGDDRPLFVIPWSEAKANLRASGYPVTPMYYQARDLRALARLVRADMMIALTANERAGAIRMEATVGSGNQFKFYDFTESASGSVEHLSDVVTRALRTDSAYVRMRHP